MQDLTPAPGMTPAPEIRSAVRSAQRPKGGARRAGDSRGAECAVGLVPHQAAGFQAVVFSGKTNNVRNGPKADNRPSLRILVARPIRSYQEHLT